MWQRPRKIYGTQVWNHYVTIFNTSYLYNYCTDLISNKFKYCMPFIYTTLHTKFEENQISCLRHMLFWKLSDFPHIFLLLCTVLINLSQPSHGLISFKLIKHIRSGLSCPPDKILKLWLWNFSRSTVSNWHKNDGMVNNYAILKHLLTLPKIVSNITFDFNYIYWLNY